MYNEHYGFTSTPFSIAPDPKFLFLSTNHREALAHLSYGFTHGGFVLITGEVGTGKTTLLRNLVEDTPEDLEVAFILNPRLTVKELLASLCDELRITYDPERSHTVKQYIDAINAHLLETHRAGRSTVLIIDEAQNLSPAVLEQLRLLTNLETNERKLLRIILLGQPELGELLARTELRQLAQRITARYHLGALDRDNTAAYIAHRLSRAGGNPGLFTPAAIGRLHRIAKGIPRLINVIADRALLGGYVEGTHRITPAIVSRAAGEVLGDQQRPRTGYAVAAAAVAAVLVAAGAVYLPVERLVPDFAAAPTEKAEAPLPAAALPTVAPTTESQPTALPPSPATEPAVADVATVAEPDIPFGDVARPTTVTTFETQRAAYRTLFELWQRGDAPDDPIPCNSAARVGLQCLARRGSWEEIANLDLPVVLELWDEQDAPYYGALIGIEDDELTLEIAGARFRTDRFSLRDNWFGTYVLLWPTPPDYNGNVRAGDAGAAVGWVRERLASIVTMDLASSAPEYFDARLDEAVRAFQYQQKLEPDGVVGPMTWIRLYQEEAIEPRLND